MHAVCNKYLFGFFIVTYGVGNSVDPNYQTFTVMLIYFFLAALYAIVGFPVVNRAAPSLVESASQYLPAVGQQYELLTPRQRTGAACVLATLVSYPGVYIGTAFVAFMLMPAAWIVMLFAALLTLSTTHNQTASLLTTYIPGGALFSSLFSPQESTLLVTGENTETEDGEEEEEVIDVAPAHDEVEPVE